MRRPACIRRCSVLAEAVFLDELKLKDATYPHSLQIAMQAMLVIRRAGVRGTSLKQAEEREPQDKDHLFLFLAMMATPPR